MKVNQLLLNVVLAVILSKVQAEPVFGDSPDEIDLKIRANLGAPEISDKSWLTEEIRPILMEKLLKLLASPDPAYRNTAEVYLVEIGHAETIEKLVEKMVEGDHQNALSHRANGEALPYLMHGIEIAPKEDPIPAPGDDIIFGSPRSMIANVTLQVIIFREKNFPKETVEWAKKIKGSMSLAENNARIDLLELWWQHNKNAILEKRYADATWLPMYKGKPSYLSDEEIADRKTDQERQRIARRSRSESTTAQSKEFTKNTSSQKLWIILTACTLFVAGLIGWKLKTRQN